MFTMSGAALRMSHWSTSFFWTFGRCLQSAISTTFFLILLGIFCCLPLQNHDYLLASRLSVWSFYSLATCRTTYLYFLWQLQSGWNLGIPGHFYHLEPSQCPWLWITYNSFQPISTRSACKTPGQLGTSLIDMGTAQYLCCLAGPAERRV